MRLLFDLLGIGRKLCVIDSPGTVLKFYGSIGNVREAELSIC
jgi:hypothetical protein